MKINCLICHSWVQIIFNCSQKWNPFLKDRFTIFDDMGTRRSCFYDMTLRDPSMIVWAIPMPPKCRHIPKMTALKRVELIRIYKLFCVKRKMKGPQPFYLIYLLCIGVEERKWSFTYWHIHLKNIFWSWIMCQALW